MRSVGRSVGDLARRNKCLVVDEKISLFLFSPFQGHFRHRWRNGDGKESFPFIRRNTDVDFRPNFYDVFPFIKRKMRLSDAIVKIASFRSRFENVSNKRLFIATGEICCLSFSEIDFISISLFLKTFLPLLTIEVKFFNQGRSLSRK